MTILAVGATGATGATGRLLVGQMPVVYNEVAAPEP
jgi:hypothetical protein